MKKIMSAFLASALLLSGIPALHALASVGDANTVSGETGRTVENITLPDGTKTGVRLTQITMNGVYGNKVINIVEADLSETHLSLDVINSGEYMVNTATVANAVKSYSVPGKTVLAAINGDLWMTSVHSNAQVTTKVLQVPRGVTIVDREVWSTEQIGMENYVATNAEQGTSSPPKAAFGVTADNQPLVGSPVISVKVSDEQARRSITADGINRLPAWDSLIVYNHRVNNSNYALNDSYEIELEADGSSAFRIGGTTTATVKAIYPSGSTTRPGIGEKTIILTARGNRMSDISAFAIGDKVTFELSVTDRYGHTDLWKNVVTAIGGHMTAVLDGGPATSLGGGEYPTSLIGYNDKGNVILCTVTSPFDKTYEGLKFSQAYDFCKDMGYNSVFFLDGGGSATMVTLKDGEYTVRNKCSDGSPRPVINSAALVWNSTPVCKKQGSLSYIKIPKEDTSDPTRLDGKTISEHMNGQYQCSTSYAPGEDAMEMKTVGSSNNDPYATLNYSLFKKVYADDYHYLVVKLRSYRNADGYLSVFFNLGSRTTPDANYCKSVYFGDGNDWQYLIFDFSTDSRWTGKINNLRFDMFDNTTMPKDVSVYFGAVALCKTRAEAESFIEADDTESVPSSEKSTSAIPDTDPVPATESAVESKKVTVTETVPVTETEAVTTESTSPEESATVPSDTMTDNAAGNETTAGNTSAAPDDTSGSEKISNGKKVGALTVIAFAAAAAVVAAIVIAVKKKKK